MPLVMAIEVAANVLLFTASAFVLLAGGQLIHLMVVMAGVQVVMALASVVVARSAHLWPAPQSRPDWTISGLMRKSLPFLGLSLTDVLQQRADLLLVSFLAGPLTTGAYAAANSLVRVLIKLAQSYWRALYPTLSRLHQGQRDRFLLLQGMALRLGWAAALWAAAVAAGLATEIMLLFFGDDFVAASAVLRILIWSAPLYLLESYFIAILFVQRQPRTGLMVALTQLGVVVAALPPLILWVGIAGAAWGVVLAGIAGVCVGAWHVGTLNASSVTTLLLMLIAALAVAAAIWRLQETPWWAVSVGAALYGLLAWLVGGVGRRDLASLRQALVG
jgi:O-antigen/teichoic acid export membrane protein